VPASLAAARQLLGGALSRTRQECDCAAPRRSADDGPRGDARPDPATLAAAPIPPRSPQPRSRHARHHPHPDVCPSTPALAPPSIRVPARQMVTLEACVSMLARLFIARPEEWTAFRELVPTVFTTLLPLGSPTRHHLNQLLLAAEFDPRLKPLVCESNDFVTAPFFWNAQARAPPRARPATIASSAHSLPRLAFAPPPPSTSPDLAWCDRARTRLRSTRR
jgi:hypothetical protein